MKNRQDGQTTGKRRTVLVEPVYESLKERIMDQGLAPQERLNIEALAVSLGTSPTPVREALARLAAERLVEFTPFKGYSVMPLLDQQQLADLMHVRRLLEAEAANLAAPRIIMADLRRMERAHDAMSGARPGPEFGTYREYNIHDQEFHETMIAASGNSILLETYRSLQVHTLLARLYHDRGKVDYLESVREHRAILDALQGHNPELSGYAVRSHIDGVEERLGSILENRMSLDGRGGVHVDRTTVNG